MFHFKPALQVRASCILPQMWFLECIYVLGACVFIPEFDGILHVCVCV